MRAVTLEVYKYAELSDVAKDRARHWYFGLGFEYAWTGEWHDTLEAFQKQFPVKVKDWEASTWRHTYVSADICPNENFNPAEMKGARAWKWLVANGHDKIRNGAGKLVPVIGEEDGTCSLTGYCADADILQPLAEFLKRPDTEKSLADVFQDCLAAWAKAYRADLEYQESEECTAEAMEANEYEFDAEGRPV